MKEIIVVLTYKRDPLLYLCLEAIRAQAPDTGLILVSDRDHSSPELEQMAVQFKCDLEKVPDRLDYGNSYAVFLGLWRGIARIATAGRLSENILHFIEDDTIIHAGWFGWARGALQNQNYAIALGRVPGDPPSTWYESPCVSWNVQRLRECLSLIPSGYCESKTRDDMLKVLDAAFPKSRYRLGSAEQDGFFLRAMEYMKLKTAFPPRSFASHLGWYGYNRPPLMKPPSGTFEEQVEECRKVLCDKKRRYELFGQGVTDREMAGM
jgi:hypothetical protein